MTGAPDAAGEARSGDAVFDLGDASGFDLGDTGLDALAGLDPFAGLDPSLAVGDGDLLPLGGDLTTEVVSSVILSVPSFDLRQDAK